MVSTAAHGGGGWLSLLGLRPGRHESGAEGAGSALASPGRAQRNAGANRAATENRSSLRLREARRLPTALSQSDAAELLASFQMPSRPSAAAPTTATPTLMIRRLR